jgi:hypothetical protein
VTIWITQENLRRAVGTCPTWKESDLVLDKVRFPSVDVVDKQREMIAAIVGLDWLRPVPNQMQLLIVAQTEPSAGKIECRAWN